MPVKRYKKRIFSGPVCEQIVWSAPSRVRSGKPPRPRFKTEQERLEHRKSIARKHCARLVNSNFTTAGYTAVLTFDEENLVDTIAEARKARDNFRRRLTYRCPDAKFLIFMGRGRTTHRLHFHLIVENVTEEDVRKAWKLGNVEVFEHLRENNTTRDKREVGKDLTGLSNYCFEHWKPEQGGHYYSRSRNLVQPEEEAPTECTREYSPEHPPLPPKGYRLIEAYATDYGYLYFRYVKIPVKPGRTRRKSRQPSYSI